MVQPRASNPLRPILSKAVLACSLVMVTCCQTPQPVPPPTQRPAPRPVQTAAPAPQTVPATPQADWIDRAQTPGDWRYVVEPGETLAAFGTAGATQLVLACDPSTRKVAIVRATSAPQQGDVAMRISTETATRAMMATPASGSPARIVATLDARDPLLDAMAITRGRFAVEVEGEPGLYVPAWAEVTRVIEDCR